MEERNFKTRDLFYGIVAVATLIVAIIGATLAYFTISAGSNEEAISAQSAKVSIIYNDSNQVALQANKLIPADEEVVRIAYDRMVNRTEEEIGEMGGDNLCLDDNDSQVCSVYRFTIKSEGDPSEAIATLNTDDNGFKDLVYAVYDVTNQNWLKLQGDGKYVAIDKICSNSTENECYIEEAGVRQYSNSYSLFGYDTDGKNISTTLNSTEHVYDVVLFIKNQPNAPQDYDQGKTYRGTLKIDLAENGGIIQGYINNK